MMNEVNEVVSGVRDKHRFGPEQDRSSRLLFPGSFNPLHQGHRQMAAIAKATLQETVEFEVSVTNVDKTSLTTHSAADRIAQFTPAIPVWLTRAATFCEKAILFPGATFVVGADTALRLFDQAYYHDADQMETAFGILRENECHFLVFGRQHRGHFLDAIDLPLPKQHAGMFRLVPESEFRMDISSSQLRD